MNIDSYCKLDVSNSLLQDLDIVIAAILTHFRQSEAELTERITLAVHNYYVKIYGHPTV